ncbi:MAG: hypothetical protein N2C14_06510, partial [Planctomycetales bacterium]
VTVVQGKGSGLVVALGRTLGTQLHPIFEWAFLIGAWGAVASSLLGVWQSVPYLFTDAWGMLNRRGSPDEARVEVDTKSPIYQGYMIGLATIPAIGLATGFAKLQMVNAIVGAIFMPMLACSLLILNGRSDWVGKENRNRWWTSLFLVLVLAFFLWAGWIKIQSSLWR